MMSMIDVSNMRLILRVYWKIGKHHSSGTSNTWSYLEKVEVVSDYVKITHLEGRTFTLDLDDMRSFEIEPDFSLIDIDAKREI